MKTINSILMALICLFLVSCAGNQLTTADRAPYSAGAGMNAIYYKWSKQLYDARGHSSCRLGAGEKKPMTARAWWASGHNGMFYTGRGYIRRWGRNASVPIEQYTWNTAKGEYFHVCVEAIEGGAHPGICWQSGNTPDEWKSGWFQHYTTTNF